MALKPSTWAVGAALFSACIAWPAHTSNDRELIKRAAEIPALLAAGRITPEEVPNPHWRDDACDACHAGTPARGKAALRDADVNRLCMGCHESISAHDYIHAVGMVPSDDKRRRMPPPFRQALARSGGVLTCVGCHDLPLQCDPQRRAARKENPLFFRAGPYAERTDLCFACHDPTHYERLNPHDQITDEGDLNSQVCMVCHTVVPNRPRVRSIDDVTFNVSGDLNKLCLGCHPSKPHPGDSLYFATGQNTHLVRPSEDIRERMKESERDKKMVLPLEPGSEKVFCATCHNPHERGVQQNEAADRGADGNWRLRMAEREDRGCTACHPY